MSGSSQPPSSFRIDAAEITAYLLNPVHVSGGPKAAFVMRQGFSIGRPDELAQALLDHPRQAVLAKSEHNGFVEKFTYEGVLRGPLGTTPDIRSVWKRESGKTYGELVTAYPF